MVKGLDVERGKELGPLKQPSTFLKENQGASIAEAEGCWVGVRNRCPPAKCWPPSPPALPPHCPTGASWDHFPDQLHSFQGLAQYQGLTKASKNVKIHGEVCRCLVLPNLHVCPPNLLRPRLLHLTGRLHLDPQAQNVT